jgi:cation-transporting P-type ATPase 13A2
MLIFTPLYMLSLQQSASKVVIRCLDIITIMVPAALPLALTIGVAAALQRLTKKTIFCTAPDHIVSAGA